MLQFSAKLMLPVPCPPLDHHQARKSATNNLCICLLNFVFASSWLIRVFSEGLMLLENECGKKKAKLDELDSRIKETK